MERDIQIASIISRSPSIYIDRSISISMGVLLCISLYTYRYIDNCIYLHLRLFAPEVKLEPAQHGEQAAEGTGDANRISARSAGDLLDR